MTTDNIIRHVWTLVAPHAPTSCAPEPKKERPEWSYPGPALLQIVREARAEMEETLNRRRKK